MSGGIDIIKKHTNVIRIQLDNIIKYDYEQDKSEELNISVSDELVKLNELYKSGAISEEDYKKAKDKILS